MKKIISLILVTTMVLSSISNAFAYYMWDKGECKCVKYFDSPSGGGVSTGNCNDKNISNPFPSTIETCEESQDCVVYKGGKLKFKDKVLFIPKEKTEEALSQVEKLIGKEMVTKAMLGIIPLSLLGESPFIVSSVKFIKELKKLENEFGLTDLKKELKKAKIELKEKRKKHEDCSKLQDEIKELKDRLNKKYREFNDKYLSYLDCKFCKSLLLGLISGFIIVHSLIDVSMEKAGEIVDKFYAINLERIEDVISTLKDRKDSIAMRLCKEDRVIAAQVPGKLYVDTEECNFLGLRSKE